MESEKVTHEQMLEKARASTNWEGRVAVVINDTVHIIPILYVKRCEAEVIFYQNSLMYDIVPVADWEDVRATLEAGCFNRITIFDEMVDGVETHKTYFCN